MLKALSIFQFALIDSLNIEFSPGLNIITGETGAGKSVMIDALMVVLGERASADMLRQGAEKGFIEGTFGIDGHKPLQDFLEQNGYDAGRELILRREFSAKGTTRCFLNDSPATVGLLRTVGNFLVDFHGQHEHQSLLHHEYHLTHLDNAGGTEHIREEYQSLWKAAHALEKELQELSGRERSLRQQEEFQRFQLSEIESINPQPGEIDQLENELSVIENSGHLHDSTQQIYLMLYDDDNSVRDTMIRARNLLGQLSEIDHSFRDYHAECQSAIVTIEEIAKFSQSYNSRLEFHPARLEQIRERLVLLHRLRKKYGTFEAVFSEQEKLRREINLADNFELELSRLSTALAAKRQELGACALRLSARRREIARKVEQSVIATLRMLGIQHANFSVEFRRHTYMPDNGLFAETQEGNFTAWQHGIDDVEFYISTNAGEDLRPLAKVASGGEISRVMLALKSILAKSDRLPMLVFDEIDTGISGRIAQKVGLAMKDLADFHQIIAITHSAQIAALADFHISVEKFTKDGKTGIIARHLDQNARIAEIAKLISGESVTQSALESAAELMQAAFKRGAPNKRQEKKLYDPL
jgi:DNA repair protein RecN (Recombination protein N)